MPQVTARLSPKIRARFEQYAQGLELDASELARILIVRELRVRRILRLQTHPSERPAKSLDKAKDRKLTAHFHSANIIAEFDRYSTAQGFNRSDAAKLIFERELTKKWLLKALAWDPKDSQA